MYSSSSSWGCFGEPAQNPLAPRQVWAARGQSIFAASGDESEDDFDDFDEDDFDDDFDDDFTEEDDFEDDVPGGVDE